MKKLTIKDIYKLAESKGIICLSLSYKNNRTKLKWECPAKHRWWATANKIQQGRRCFKCSNIKHISEEKCRYTIEHLTKYKFLKNRTILNNKQEIDGYNKELKIGFEYQGEQHYKKINRFTKKQFQNTQRLDKRKKSRIYYLKKQGIIKDIIFIKYTQATSDKKLENYIIKRLNKIDPNLIKNTNIDIDYSGFYKYLSPLNDIKDIINKKGGNLIDNTYINNKTKLKIRCKNYHIFEMTPNNLKSGKWCSVCSGTSKGTIEELKKMVEDKHGELLDNIYINNRTKVKIKCKNNHIFKTTKNNLRLNQWCPYCAGNAKLGVEFMQELARQHDCSYCSSKYTNVFVAEKWQCNICGDKWKRSYIAMNKRKYFCQKCHKNKQKLNH